MRTSRITATSTPAMITHSKERRCGCTMIVASSMTSRDMGMMMKLASRLAARVEVVWLETTTAPVTIISAWAVVSSTICTTSSGAGRHCCAPRISAPM